MDDLILHLMDRGREFTSFIALWLGWLTTGWFDWRDYHSAPFPWVLEDIISRALTPSLPPPLYIYNPLKKELRTLHFYTSSTNLPIYLLISSITPSSSNLDRPWPIPVFTHTLSLSLPMKIPMTYTYIFYYKKHPREYSTFLFSLIKEYTFAVKNYLYPYKTSIFPIIPSPLAILHYIKISPPPLFRAFLSFPFLSSLSSPS